MVNLGRFMGNRYTRTTLTAREIKTIDGCYHKLLAIWAKRKDNTNEVEQPIIILSRILDDMYRLKKIVNIARKKIDEEARAE